MFGLGFQELVIVGIVAVLLFGKRLPEVAKSLGHSYREFRKGLGEIQSTVDFSDTYTPPSSHSSGGSYDDYDEYDEPTAPKFEPPPAEPRAAASPDGNISKPISER